MLTPAGAQAKAANAIASHITRGFLDFSNFSICEKSTDAIAHATD